MHLIIEHDEKTSSYLDQYTTHIEHLSANYKILDLEEKYLPWLNEIAGYIEPNFTIELVNEKNPLSESIINSHNMILASIGLKDENKRVDAYYNMTTHTLEQRDKVRDVPMCQWINCYSNTPEIDAATYIKCIRYLSNLSSEWHKPIVIYANIYVPNEKYRYRSLTYKIINSYLTALDGVLITPSFKANISKYYTPLDKAYEFYLDQSIYLENSLNEVLIKVIPILYASHDPSRFKNLYSSPRQNPTLYEDIFYESLSPDLEIYVPLNLANFRQPADYEALGLEHIPLIGDYGMLYAKKGVFDELSEVLRPEVNFPYYMPILSHSAFRRISIDPTFSYRLVPENLEYKGKGVYIGVVATDDVDYTTQVLRTLDGKSRIACIWQQASANQGTYYYKEQIDMALASDAPGEIIKLPEGDSLSTMMLGIAGGKNDESPTYSGVATESEFIVAKVNTAPEALQMLYGGMPSKSAITMADALIGALKLINFARAQKKSLVLCIPFNANIDPHDGSLILYQMLGQIAQWDNLTIIIPAGEEADKLHHYGLEGNQPPSTTVTMNVQQENQNIVGIIYQRFSNIFTTILYPPPSVVAAPINLKLVGITNLQQSIIYSNGYKINFLNGAIRILFRIVNPQVGIWRFAVTSATEALSQIDIWISQQELNEHITLSPASPFITVGSLGNTNNVMTVGGYDKESMVVLRSSGRGYSWDNRVKPLFITHASNIIAPYNFREWGTVTGTIPAASIMLGVVATLYSKYIEEDVFPFPNTLVMNSIILSTVKQFNGVEYPNRSQGYGIFDIETLDALLSTAFIL